jgi:hypothetical protein
MSFMRAATGGIQDAGLLLFVMVVGLPAAILVIGAPVALLVWVVTLIARQF